MKSVLCLMVALAAAALPVHAAETSLPALMRLLPQAWDRTLRPGEVLLSYARLDLLAGGRGPTQAAGATRAAPVGRIAPMGVNGLDLAQVARWPAMSGFDFDAIEALLVLETGGMPNGIFVLAGARMPGLAALADPLSARGFASGRIAGREVLARGEDNDVDVEHRAVGEAIGYGVALSLRFAAPAPGVLIATREDALMGAALGAAEAGRSLADVPELRALAASSAGGPGARDLAQAVVYLTALRGASPIRPGTFDEVRRALTSEMRDTDTLPGPPPWAFAMLSERRDAEGIVTRLALPYRLRPAAEAAAGAMAARLAAMAPPPGIGPVRAVVEEHADGIFVAAIEARQPPGTDVTLFVTINGRHHNGLDTPMTIGPVPRATFAR